MQTQASFGHRDQTSVFALRGVVRYPQARALRNFVDDVVLKADCDTVFIDLKRVEAIDSTGMGLLARIGRATIERRGRRAVLVGPQRDIATCLKSAAFDTVFHMVDEYPFDPQVELKDVPIESDVSPQVARVMLDAHRTLAELGEQNRSAYADVIAALDAEVRKRRS